MKFSLRKTSLEALSRHAEELQYIVNKFILQTLPDEIMQCILGAQMKVDRQIVLYSMVLLLALLSFVSIADAESNAALPVNKYSKELLLTPQEKAWLAAHPLVRVRISRSYPPFEFFEKDHFQGIAFDYLSIIGKQLGIEFHPTPDMSWKDALESLKNRDGVDMVLMITSDESRDYFVEFTRNYLSFPQVIFTRKDSEFISGLKDLEGSTVAIENSFIEASKIKRDVHAVKIIETMSTLKALEAVSTGKADAYVGNLGVATYLIEKNGLTNLKVAAPSLYPLDTYAMGVRKDWAVLARILDKALAAISEEEQRSINQRWLSVRFEHGIRPRDVAFWLLLAITIALSPIIPLRYIVRKKTKELSRQKDLLASVMDNTFQFQGLLSLDGTVVNVNNSALDLIGATKQAVVGQLFWETPWWSHDPKVQQTLKESIYRCAKGEVLNFETTNGDAMGCLHQIDFSLKPLRGESGEIIYLIPEGRDITELKKREADLRDSESRFRTLIEDAPIGISMIRDGRYFYSNRAHARIFGFDDPTEIIGTPLIDRFAAEFREKLTQKALLLETGEIMSEQFETIGARKDGTHFPYLVSATHLNLRDGPVIISFGTDITERQQTRDLMIQSEKMTTIAGMAAGIAHEVNNPLGVIAQDLQNLERRFSPSLPANCKVADEIGLDLELVAQYMERRDMLNYVSSMRSGVKRASAIISNMLQFSRQSDSSHQLVDLNDILDQSVKLASNDFDLRNKYDFKNVTIIREYDENLTQVSACITEMEQVFINLLKNAAQAMIDAGTENPSIYLSTSRRKEQVVVAIKDNGPGISDTIRQRIFDPFFTTKDVGIGTGLGLAVTHTIVTKNHAGELSVDSTPGHGACFTIKLPVVVA